MIKCLICSKQFYIRPCRKKTAKYCSRKCRALGMVGRKHTPTAKAKISLSRMGEKNWNWKGGVYIRKDGYVQINHKGKLYKEHRFVMEKYLGRKLLPNENVHHKNGVRHDNRIENLELWTKPPTKGIRAKDALKYAREIIELYVDIESKL